MLNEYWDRGEKCYKMHFGGNNWANLHMYFLLNNTELMLRCLNMIMVFNYIEFSYS